MRMLFLLVVLAVAACGPSSGQIRAARVAQYDTESGAVFAAVQEVASTTYGIADRNDEAMAVQTADRWFTSEGSSAGRGTEDHPTTLSDGMVALSFLIRVDGSVHRWVVTVEPVASKLVSFSSSMQPLGTNDMPFWVQDKVDSLYVAIYEKLKASAVAPAP